MKTVQWVLMVLLGVMLMTGMRAKMVEQQEALRRYQVQVQERNREIKVLKSRVNKVESQRSYVCENVAKAIIPLDNK